MFLFAKGKKLQNRTLTKGEQTSLNKFRLEQAEPKNCWKLASVTIPMITFSHLF